jgi:Mn-containing catalase
MFYTDYKLQFPVRVETPDPVFARALQQAIGGIEGEIRVAMQYLFQAWAMRGPSKYRELLLNTAAEEIGHIEMLATAVAKNLEGAPLQLQEDAAQDAAVGSIMGGRSFKQFLSAGLGAMPVDSDGVPFDMSHVYASGNIAGDMYANVTAEGTGRTLATRLYNMTNDPGMKEMLAYLIARDTMHQNQWMAVIRELEAERPQMPVPNSFPQDQENQDFSYVFLGFTADGAEPPRGRWSEGESIDGKGTFSSQPMDPLGDVPDLGPAAKGVFPQVLQLAPEDQQ